MNDIAAVPAESNDAIAQLLDKDEISASQWLIMLVALILNMLDGFDVTAMAFTAHRIGEELAIPPQQLGIVFSVALAGMMLGAMFLAPLSDLFGRRKMVLVSVLAIGLSMIATGFASTLWPLIVLRLLTGLGVGALLASLATITAEHTPARYRSLSVVAITAGYPLGATLGGFIAAPLLAQFGWQSVFFAGGMATLSMVIIVYFWIPESMQFLLYRRPPGALEELNRILRKMKAVPLESLPPKADNSTDQGANVLSLLDREYRAKTVQLWLTFFFCFISLYFLMSWIPKLIVLAGLSETQGVYGAAMFNGGGVLGILTLGWAASRANLSLLIAVFLLLTAICMLLFSIAADHLPMLTSLFVVGYFLQGGFCGLYAVAAKLYPVEIRTTGVGWAIGLGRFGAVVGPYLGGFLIATGATMASNFLIFAVPAFLAALLAWRLKVA